MICRMKNRLLAVLLAVAMLGTDLVDKELPSPA